MGSKRGQGVSVGLLKAAIDHVRALIPGNLAPAFEEGMQYGMIGSCVPHRIDPAGYHCDPKQSLPFICLAVGPHHIPHRLPRQTRRPARLVLRLPRQHAGSPYHRPSSRRSRTGQAGMKSIRGASPADQPPFPRPPVFAKATTGRPVRPIGSFRGLPQKANSLQSVTPAVSPGPATGFFKDLQKRNFFAVSGLTGNQSRRSYSWSYSP
jgi:hypothetical protein